MGCPIITTNGISERTGVPPWTVRKLFDDGTLPPCVRVGRWRVINEADMPAVEAVLRARGLIKTEPIACG